MYNNDSEQTDTIYVSDTINMQIYNSKKFTYIDKKQLIKRINDIKTKKCYIKIFKLIHNDNLKYTKNDNGIFFNITNLSDEILTNIDIILNFYESKKSDIDEQFIKNNTKNINNNLTYNIFTDDSESKN